MRIRKVLGLVLGLLLLSPLAVAQPGNNLGRGYHSIDLAGPNPREVLVETPHLKVVKLRVKAGSTLDFHAVPEQVSILPLKGSGQVVLRDGSLQLDAAHMVVLAPGMEHSIRAAEDANLILLVHYVRTGLCRGPGCGMGPGMGPRRGMGPGRDGSAN